jgi:hypothetical protein
MLPSPALCDVLSLNSTDATFDLRDPDGNVGCLYRNCRFPGGDGRPSHLLYLRADLARDYLDSTTQELAWLWWGERLAVPERIGGDVPQDVREAYADDAYMTSGSKFLDR